MPSRGNGVRKGGEERWGGTFEELEGFPYGWSVAVSRVLGQRSP